MFVGQTHKHEHQSLILIKKVFPEIPKAKIWIREVRFYYRIPRVFNRMLRIARFVAFTRLYIDFFRFFD
jgi:hypothetical protein